MSVRLGITFSLLLAVAALASAPEATSVAPGAELFDVTVQTGSCDWYCGSTKYRTAAACDLACDEACERLCW